MSDIRNKRLAKGVYMPDYVSEEAFHSLRAYFSRVRKGNDVEYRTTFYKDKSLTAVLDGWKPVINTLEDSWPTLLDFENDLRNKVGPMSIMKPLKERIDDIRSYYDSILLESEPLDPEAIAKAVKWFGGTDVISVRSERFTLQNMKLSTNSGLPYFTKRSIALKRLDEPLQVDYNSYLQVTNLNSLDEVYEAAAVLGWRGQEGGLLPEDVKQRVVWMFPFSVNLQELKVYQPLIEWCQAKGSVPAWVSMEAVDLAITQLFDTKAPDDLVVCTDFSKFDQHFNKDMQNAARSILISLLSPDEDTSLDWIHNIFPIKYNIPLMIDWGRVVFGPHGMGSGSGGTNADETLVHRALQYEAALHAGVNLNPFSQCLGDDGILSYPGITVEEVVDTYSKHGQEMNHDKQYASVEDCVYLRRWHHRDYRIDDVCAGVYSTYRALGRLCEQERYYDPDIWGPEMVALRQLSILENVKYHPLREKFADYCMKGDKYRLGIDLPGFFDKIERLAKEATAVMPDFLGYTREQQGGARGIKDWWIVQYLKSKM